MRSLRDDGTTRDEVECQQQQQHRCVVVQVTYTFCYDFITLLVNDAKTAEFGRTEVLVEGLTRVSRTRRFLVSVVVWRDCFIVSDDQDFRAF